MAQDTDSPSEMVRAIAARSSSRLDLWATLVRRVAARTVTEVGVYRGEFAAHLLDGCPSIDTYYMIDPWRHLDDWNKPANRDDGTFERIFAEAMERTRSHERRRVVLRGRTTAVIDQVPDGSVDFAYVDGDHTLRGITIDLARVHAKVRRGGWIAGDDFAPSIWQHGPRFEPTLVFPYAVHFAEAVGARIYGLPYRQFLIEKEPDNGFDFVDLTGNYGSLALLAQLASRPSAATDTRPAPARQRRVAALLQRALRLNRRG